MTEEQPSKENTEMTYTVKIACWLREVRKIGTGRYQNAFKTVDDQWFNTYPSPDEKTVAGLPEEYPKGSTIRFATIMKGESGNEKQYVKLLSFEKVADPERPDQKTIEQSAEKTEKEPEKDLSKDQISPKSEPKRNMQAVNKYNYDKNRSITLNVLIKEACECVRGKDISIEEQPEEIAKLAEKLDKALQEKFPELRQPE